MKSYVAKSALITAIALKMTSAYAAASVTKILEMGGGSAHVELTAPSASGAGATSTASAAMAPVAAAASSPAAIAASSTPSPTPTPAPCYALIPASAAAAASAGTGERRLIRHQAHMELLAGGGYLSEVDDKVEVNEKERKVGTRLRFGDISWSSLSTLRPSEAPVVPSLHVSGGGVRGIIPATILREVESQTKTNALNLFEFFSGASTGGILVGAINTGHFTAADLVDMYKDNASTIFQSRYWFNPWGVRGPNYSISNLRSVLRDYVGNSTVADFGKDVLLPMYDVRSHSPLIVKSWKARSNASRNFYAVDALSGTGAAPTFFEPVRMFNFPGDPTNRLRREHIVVDGGLVDNTSMGCALTEMNTLYGRDVRHICVSLGTGQETPENLTYESVSGMGTLGLGPRVIDWMLQASLKKSEYRASQELPPIGDFQQYYSFNPTIDHQYAAMDNASDENLEQLEQYGIDLIERESIQVSVINLIRRLENLREDGLLARKIRAPAAAVADEGAVKARLAVKKRR